jgi:hypothetical protein
VPCAPPHITRVLTVAGVPAEDRSRAVRSSVISFFDLASSDLLQHEARGTVAVDGRSHHNMYMDQSIYSLGMCIKVLSRASRRRARDSRCGAQWQQLQRCHIVLICQLCCMCGVCRDYSKEAPPAAFGDSILTLLLTDSLSRSRTRTSIICTVSPVFSHCSETMNTLTIARRYVYFEEYYFLK